MPFCLHSALFICTALIFNSLSSVDTIYTRLHFLYTHLQFSTRICTFSTHHKKNEMPFASTTPFYGHGRQPSLLREPVFSVAPTQKSPSLYNRKQMLSPQLQHSPDKQCITCQWLLHSVKLKMVQCRQQCRQSAHVSTLLKAMVFITLHQKVQSADKFALIPYRATTPHHDARESILFYPIFLPPQLQVIKESRKFACN